jgi:hypothetical protein
MSDAVSLPKCSVSNCDPGSLKGTSQFAVSSSALTRVGVTGPAGTCSRTQK